MRNHPVRALAPFVAAVLLVGCGSSQAPAASSAPPASVAPSVAESASAAPSVESAAPSESAAASAGGSAAPSVVLPSGLNGAPDLEAQLPSKVGNVTLQKVSFSGATLAGAGDNAKELQSALGLLGKSINDVSLAIAGGQGVEVGAYRISGVDAGRLLDVVTQAMSQSSSAITLSDGNKGGKSVKIGTPKSGSGDKTYFYPHGDILFFASGSDDSLVTQALQALP